MRSAHAAASSTASARPMLHTSRSACSATASPGTQRRSSHSVAAAAEQIPSSSHADALGSIDATVGGLTDEAKDAGADTVTAALAALADERDSGAITEDEFQARKQELLDRL